MQTESARRKPGAQPLEVAKNPEALLRLQTVSALVGLARSAIYARIQRGEFPAPIKLSARCSRWKAGAVRAWLSEQTGARA